MSSISLDEDISLNDIPLDDILYDYLMMIETFGASDPDVIEYRLHLEKNGVDVNNDSYTKYHTVSGTFMHYRHNATGKTI
jgi:hypothetical protein